jgi:molybdopterin molybdotransferase
MRLGLTVTRRPVVALIATGDELVLPGETPRHDQIVASNTYGLKALIEAEGGVARMLPIARDDAESLTAVFDLARGADLIVTVGGASVGDHDLVGSVAESLGLERAFYKIAMRPGKPLMAGRLGEAPAGLARQPGFGARLRASFPGAYAARLPGLPAGESGRRPRGWAPIWAPTARASITCGPRSFPPARCRRSCPSTGRTARSCRS